MAMSIERLRLIPDLETDVIEMITGSLRRRFPNFSPVIDHLATELTFAMASTAEAFRLPPLLLYGAPGIGKTAFSNALARLLGVGFTKISAAGAQGAFDLVGSSIHWSEASPGAIFTILADGDYATPVVLIDEIDKMPQDSRFPMIPAFLEFLEPESAKTFTDQSMTLPFDASKVIVVATANEIDDISGPLLSRLVPLEVNSPTVDERRQIVATVFRESVEGLVFDIDISDDAIDTLAKAPIDVRAIKQTVRLAIGIAIGRQDGMVDTVKIPFKGEKERRRVGFI